MSLAKSTQLSSCWFLWQCFHSFLTVAGSRPQQAPDTLGIWSMMLLYANRKSHFRVGDLDQEYHCNSDLSDCYIELQKNECPQSAQDFRRSSEMQSLVYMFARGREKPSP